MVLNGTLMSGSRPVAEIRLGRVASLGREYLDILFMDALCFNMDRHTKNYGILRDRDTGKVLRMAPNFDNNIALISRGYGADPRNTFRDRSHPMQCNMQ